MARQETNKRIHFETTEKKNLQWQGFCKIKDQPLDRRAINTKWRSQGSAWAKNLEDREDYDPQLVGIKALLSLVKWKTISSYLLEIWGQPKAN